VNFVIEFAYAVADVFYQGQVEWDFNAGLAAQIISSPRTLQSSQLPTQLAANCDAQNRPHSGNAAGHASVGDLSGLPSGPFREKFGWTPRGIGAMTGCVASATLGMAAVIWYAMGAHDEAELQRREEERQAKGNWKDKIFRKKT
jgi:iron transport multicopper oxidase